MADISKIKLPDNTEYEIKDAKARMVILRYGISTWQDFMDAYQNNCVIYCRASSNSNPATGSQTRLAFMAYVTDATNPTNVEFQYYRSVNKHTDAQQGNQVYVYKLTNANKWTVTVRNTFSKVIAGDNLTSSFVESETNSSITLSADYDSTVTENSTKLITSGAVYTAIANQPVPDLADLPDVTITTPSDGDVLTYDSTNNEWVNGQGGSGSSTLADLSDVDISTPSNGDVLKYDSTNDEWVNGQVSNVSSLDDLTNVTITTPTDGQILKYDGTNQEWINASGGGGSSDPHITLTQAQYDALVQAGTVDPNAYYFISDATLPSYVHNYSTDEQVVGTWVDGSTLYEKTVYYAGGINGTINIPHNISNISKCVDTFGTCYDIGYLEGGQRVGAGDMPLPRIASDHNNIGITGVNKTNIVISIGSIWGDRITDFYITLRYTKVSS